MLYVLRRGEATAGFVSNVLDCTGEAHHGIGVLPGYESLGFVGEYFILGLMDGEVLDMIGSDRKRDRPAPLRSMDEDFRKVYVF